MGGKFSEDQRAIYQGVLNAQRAVLDIMVPGTPWIECHKVTFRRRMYILCLCCFCFLYFSSFMSAAREKLLAKSIFVRISFRMLTFC